MFFRVLKYFHMNAELHSINNQHGFSVQNEREKIEKTEARLKIEKVHFS